MSVLHALVAIALSQAGHKFVFQTDRPVTRVAVAGTFNNWDRGATPMTLTAGKWVAVVPLAPGKHLYKFVLNDSEWVTDPLAKQSEDDGNGNVNSVLIVSPPGYEKPARTGDGVITNSVVSHPLGVPFRNYDRGRLSLSLRARAGDLDSVYLVANGKSSPMKLVSSDELYSTYRGELAWDLSRDVAYRFELKDGPTRLSFGQGGLGSARPIVVKAKGFAPFVVPSWVERTVIYQIFPDRFANGDPSNDPPDVIPWDGRPTYFNRFGGDIAGVRARGSYLAGLGVGAIYFNPIFKSPSNHRYETSDYFQIDPQLGSNEQFVAATKELSALGIRTVLDGVFNHTAVDFGPFSDLIRNGESSRYRNWYFPKSFPIKVGDPPNYAAWFNFPSMPKLNHANPEVTRYLLSVPAYWQQRARVSGWRLDVANEVPMSFWRSFRKTVKSVDPETWIVGEVWGDGSPWLGGDQWDSVMNYQFREAVIRFVATGNSSPSQFMSSLMRTYSSYAPQVSRNLMNLLGSHDTPRFLSVCRGDRELARLGATIQFTWVGAPSIYYGDELGMEGLADPDNRRGMRWDLASPSNDMLAHYKWLVAIRKASRALQSGDPVVLATDDQSETLAYARVLDREAVVVAVNRSSEPRTLKISSDRIRSLVNEPLVDAAAGSAAWSPSSRSLVVRLGPKSAAILCNRATYRRAVQSLAARPAPDARRSPI